MTTNHVACRLGVVGVGVRHILVVVAAGSSCVLLVVEVEPYSPVAVVRNEEHAVEPCRSCSPGADTTVRGHWGRANTAGCTVPARVSLWRGTASTRTRELEGTRSTLQQPREQGLFSSLIQFLPRSAHGRSSGGRRSPSREGRLGGSPQQDQRRRPLWPFEHHYTLAMQYN